MIRVDTDEMETEHSALVQPRFEQNKKHIQKIKLTCAVRLRNNNQAVDPPQLPEERWAPQGAELPPKLLAQPFTNEALFEERPGGGPRDFGAPHSSEVTAVAGLRSPRALDAGSLLWGLKNKFLIICLSIKFELLKQYTFTCKLIILFQYMLRHCCLF